LPPAVSDRVFERLVNLIWSILGQSVDKKKSLNLIWSILGQSVEKKLVKSDLVHPGLEC